MKVILLGEVKGKGGEGDVVDVAAGFANNYLLPRRLAEKATPGNLKQLEMRKHNIEKRELARTTDANTLLEALNGKQVIVPAKVGEEGQLFGSVTTAMIAEAIKEQIGVEIDRKKIDLRNAIKQAGEHTFTYSIYREIRAELSVKVVDEENPEGDADEAAEEDVAEEAAPAEAEDEAVEEEAAAEAEEEAEAEE
ncbi:MAG: 50S ribosomal protein L9 [Actinomycetota bacterium]|nr:50S ribosomal protein L9 [Actinomycetota bacterium]